MLKRLICVAVLTWLVAGCGGSTSETQEQDSVDKSSAKVDQSPDALSPDVAKTDPGSLSEAKDAPEVTVDQTLARAERLLQTNPSTAIVLLEEVLSDEPKHRRALLLLTQATQQQAIALIVEQNNPTDGYRMFIRSADVIRELIQAHEDITATEQRWLGTALYNEACAYAVRGDTQKALKALQKSVDAGYNDVSQTQGDEDLESLRDLPEYKKIIEEMKRS